VSPISSTLIYGKRDAVLVDAFITVEQAGALADWVAARQNLTTIYATHATGSFLQRQYSSPTISARPPGCDADVVKMMRSRHRRRASRRSGIRVSPVRFPIICDCEELTDNGD